MKEREWRTVYLLSVLTLGTITFFLLTVYDLTDELVRDFCLSFIVIHLIVKTTLLKPKDS
ncbi:hypothetical protein ACFSCX_19725 [Bacillus salitolerans]|uniref:Uncharacterized protein n=1 Tax=Bacillus salitolerans TaxID=1437434 RepID=A0ABW4LUG2_9BACI